MIAVQKADLLNDVSSYETQVESPVKNVIARAGAKWKRKGEGKSGCKNKRKRK